MMKTGITRTVNGLLRVAVVLAILASWREAIWIRVRCLLECRRCRSLASRAERVRIALTAWRQLSQFATHESFVFDGAGGLVVGEFAGFGVLRRGAAKFLIGQGGWQLVVALKDEGFFQLIEFGLPRVRREISAFAGRAFDRHVAFRAKFDGAEATLLIRIKSC